MVEITAASGRLSFDFSGTAIDKYQMECVDVPSNYTPMVIRQGSTFVEIYVVDGITIKLDPADVSNVGFTGTTPKELRNYIQGL